MRMNVVVALQTPHKPLMDEDELDEDELGEDELGEDELGP